MRIWFGGRNAWPEPWPRTQCRFRGAQRVCSPVKRLLCWGAGSPEGMGEQTWGGGSQVPVWEDGLSLTSAVEGGEGQDEGGVEKVPRFPEPNSAAHPP